MKQPEYIRTNQRLVFREGRTKAVGNITKLIPMVSSTNTHGPKIKPIKNMPKHHNQSQHNQGGPGHQQDSGGPSGSGQQSSTASGNNENAAPRANGGGTESSESYQLKADLENATHLTDLTTIPSQDQQGQQKRNRNKRGGRGRHGGGGGHNEEVSSGTGSSVVPLGEANV
jgi:hypothetical protein